jgi:release factor glutamine methyltransferase
VAELSPEPSDEPDPELVAALRAAGCVFAEEEAALLQVGSREGGDLPLMVARRVAGEPLEQVLGWAEFCGLRIRVTSGVFVPRKRTEAVVELAVKLAAHLDRPPVVVDLCCGTGAIGVAVAVSLTGIELHAADVDPDAVACARLNVTVGRVHEGDLYDALPEDLRGRVDLLLVNAPYVPTDEIRLMPPEARLHEHHVALDGGADGVEIHRRVAAEASGWLAPGGDLLIETSPRQAADTAHFCMEAGLTVQVLGVDPVRVVRAISSGSGSSGTMAR